MKYNKNQLKHDISKGVPVLMTLTKSQIIDVVHKQNSLNKKQSIETVDTLLKIIKQTLESGEDVLISGFGKFCVKEKSERRGRNPATGESMMLDKRRVVTFKCSGKLKEKVN